MKPIERHHDWSRRQFLSAGLVAAGALLVPAILRAAEPPGVVSLRKDFWAMGGWSYLDVSGETRGAAEAGIKAMVESIRAIDRVFSVFDSRTPLSRLNSDSSCRAAIDDPLLLSALAASLCCARDFDGVFDPTVEPLMRRWGFRDSGAMTDQAASRTARDWDYRMIECDLVNARVTKESCSIQLDSGGWAKGLAAECSARAAMKSGASSAQANCGGDIFRMDRSGPPQWECAIRDPLGTRTDCAVRVRHRFPTVATSGNYETFRSSASGQLVGHLMDPRTGRPAATDLLSVSVFGHDGLAVDAASSALFVMGRNEAGRWLAANPTFAAVLIDQRWPRLAEGLLVIGDLELVQI